MHLMVATPHGCMHLMVTTWCTSWLQRCTSWLQRCTSWLQHSLVVLHYRCSSMQCSGETTQPICNTPNKRNHSEVKYCFHEVTNSSQIFRIYTWPIPSLSRRSERRRHENILQKVLIQRNCEYRQCTTQELSFQWHRRSPGQRFVWGVEEIAHFSTARTWSSTRLFRWEGSRQHDRTPTKIASALENFPATVIMPSAWPDWSKFQCLRSWHDPAEIRTTRTTTYQTWSERSNH